ncbi:unnamed protein product [Cuscuta epithymum]|uniref:Uncharacterized protein n=1 Tax=Cuscuta epithymum TaxID=186058 RepID=A0AAV0FVU3_9ASTE|nr:unnamed protein product [Cuscuta epithymum]
MNCDKHGSFSFARMAGCPEPKWRRRRPGGLNLLMEQSRLMLIEPQMIIGDVEFGDRLRETTMASLYEEDGKIILQIGQQSSHRLLELERLPHGHIIRDGTEL